MANSYASIDEAIDQYCTTRTSGQSHETSKIPFSGKVVKEAALPKKAALMFCVTIRLYL